MMVTSRLQRALQRIDEVPAEQQDEIAAIIEDTLAPYLDRPSYAGALAGLLPDDAEEQLLRLRRSSSPTPPLEDQLRELLNDGDDGDDGEERA
jgi:hypothetical protein